MKGSREFKGNSLLEDVSDYVAIDLETIGLDPMYDDIIEFGAVKVSNGIIIDKFQSLINPGYEISPLIASDKALCSTFSPIENRLDTSDSL